MKVLIILFLCISFTSHSWAQTNTTKAKVDFKLSNWRKNLRVNYWSSYMMTTLKKLDDHSYNSSGQKTNRPISWYHQISTIYALSSNWSYYMKAIEFTTMGNTNDLSESDNQNFFQTGDWQFGVQYKLFQNHSTGQYLRFFDGVPFSKSSRAAGLVSQPNLRLFSIWSLSHSVTLLTWNAFTKNIYRSDINIDRSYFNNYSLLVYALNDKWSYQAKATVTLNHQATKTGPGTRAWNHYNLTQKAFSLGVSYQFTKNFNLTPNITAMDVTNIRPETSQFGVWVSSNIF